MSTTIRCIAEQYNDFGITAVIVHDKQQICDRIGDHGYTDNDYGMKGTAINNAFSQFVRTLSSKMKWFKKEKKVCPFIVQFNLMSYAKSTV